MPSPQDNTVYKESSRAKQQDAKKLSLYFKERSIQVSRKFVIGRDANCDISIKDDSLVSRRHAIIELVQGNYTIHDAGSTNGTYVNNNPLKKGEIRYLFDGDVIIVGKTKIHVGSKPGQTPHS